MPLQPRQALGDLVLAPKNASWSRRRTTTTPSRGSPRGTLLGVLQAGVLGQDRRSSTTRSEPGSSPSSLPSIRRAVRIDASASACRPPRYWASARISHRRSQRAPRRDGPGAAGRRGPPRRGAPRAGPPQEPGARQPDGLQPAGLPLLELGERATVPQAEGLLERPYRPLGGPSPAYSRPRAKRLELVEVEIQPLGHQPVAARHGLDGLGAEHPAKAADAALHHLGPARRRLLTPQRVGQLVGCEEIARPDQQSGEHDAVTWPERTSVVVDVE